MGLGLAGARLRCAHFWLAMGGALVPAAAAAAVDGRPTNMMRQLIEVADISSLALSPDGKRLALRTERASVAGNRYDLEWHIIDLGSATVRRIAAGGDAIIRDPGLIISEPPIWSPDGDRIYYRALHGGEVQIWRSAADGSETGRVTSEAGDVETMGLSSDGRAIEFGVGPPRAEIELAERAEYDDGIFVDRHVELGQNVFRGAIVNGRPTTQRLTGSWFGRGGLLWHRPLTSRRLEFKGHSISASLSAPGQPPGGGTAGVAAVSAEGDKAAASWNGEVSDLTVRKANGDLISCRARACRAERIAWLAWRPGRDAIVFASTAPSLGQQIWLWEPASGRLRSIAKSVGLIGGGRLESAPCAATSNEVICVTAEAGAPPRLEAIELSSKRRKILFDPNAEYRALPRPRIEHLEWESGEGRLFTGKLFLPPVRATRPLPLFINYYRCEGFIRGGLGDEWPFEAMARAGIASVCINATRMPGPQDGVGQYRAAEGGIEALISLLARRELVDPGQVGIGGLSFGSEVAMWMAMHTNLVAAISVASPQFEPGNYWFNGVRGRDHHEILRKTWGLGAPDETPEQWRLLSPALNVEKINAPVLMQLPEQESRYAVELYARLTNSTTPAEMYVFPDEPHLKVQPRHRMAIYQRNLDWFRFWLLDQADDDPVRASQYMRWNELRQRAHDEHRSRQERSQSSIDTRSKTRK